MKRALFSSALIALPIFLGTGALGEDVCQIDQSVAYAPRATCVFPACPPGARCPAPEILLDRQASSVELSDPLLAWEASCPDASLTGGCWQATFDAQLRLGATGQADTISVRLITDNGQQPTSKEYTVKADRVTDTRVQGRLSVVYYVAPGQNLSLRVEALCAKTKAGRQLCVQPLRSTGWSGLKTSSRTRR